MESLMYNSNVLFCTLESLIKGKLSVLTTYLSESHEMFSFTKQQYLPHLGQNYV